MQEAMSAAQYQPTGAEDVYPPGAHVIGHTGLHGEGGEGQEADPSQVPKRTAEWVQDGEEEQDEAKKARIEGDPGAVQSTPIAMSFKGYTCMLACN